MRNLQFWILTWLTCAFAAHGQDIHFSQFHVSPMLQNPANAGFFNCDYRLTAIYRNQWKSISEPYKTFAASGDMRFVNRRGAKDIVGAGISLFNDKAGDGNLSHTNLAGTFAFHKNMDRFGVNYFGAGLSVSYGSGSVDFFKLRFPDQYVSPGQTKPTQQPIFESFGYVDASLGLEYNWIPESKTNHVQVGVALHHANEPRKTFLNNSQSRIPRKFVVHSSGQVRVNERFELYPKVNLAFQATSREYMFGTFGRLDLDKMRNDLYGIYLGMWMRLNSNYDRAVGSDALVIVTRLDMNQVSIAFSYDITVSSLKTAAASRGGPELSIIYIGCLPNPIGGKVYCPRF